MVIVIVRRAVVAAVAFVVLAACSPPPKEAAPVPLAAAPTTQSPFASPTASPTPSPTPSKSPSPTKKPKPKPSATYTKPVKPGADKPPSSPAPTASGTPDPTPTHGAGTFTIASGGTDVIGTGATLVTYQVEVENGISWGAVPPWSAASFAAAVDEIIAAPRGWIDSGAHPVTINDHITMTDESWSFQRLSSGSPSVQIRLATPDTVDYLCGTAGMTTEGIYSCRYGRYILINLRRWLFGATGFTNMSVYRNMVINHEMGHFLGFDHMLCPGPGKLAPVMQQQTVSLNGCVANPYPFTSADEFVIGPWAPS